MAPCTSGMAAPPATRGGPSSGQSHTARRVHAHPDAQPCGDMRSGQPGPRFGSWLAHTMLPFRRPTVISFSLLRCRDKTTTASVLFCPLSRHVTGDAAQHACAWTRAARRHSPAEPFIKTDKPDPYGWPLAGPHYGAGPTSSQKKKLRTGIRAAFGLHARSSLRLASPTAVAPGRRGSLSRVGRRGFSSHWGNMVTVAHSSAVGVHPGTHWYFIRPPPRL